MVGKPGRVGGSSVGHEVGGIQIQQGGVSFACGLPPRVEVSAGHHFSADVTVVEGEELVVVDDDVGAPHPVHRLLGVLEQRAIAVEERVLCTPVALHERVADEQLAGNRGIDRAVVHPSFGDQRDAVEGDPLVGHGR